jgi:hypothetical protein
VMRLEFSPRFEILSTVSPTASIADLELERGVYSATPRFVAENCGDISRALLKAVPDSYYAEAERLGLYPNCDVRIHRLYPGDYPAYPGWHCDGEYRETYFSQPDLDRINVSHHITATVSSHEGGVSNTQFLNEPFACEVDPAIDVALWGQVHRQLEKKPNKILWDTSDGQLVHFDARTLHRAMPTKVRGWRLFFRMSMWHKPNLGDGGMLTKQEQVYKVVEGSGW